MKKIIRNSLTFLVMFALFVQTLAASPFVVVTTHADTEAHVAKSILSAKGNSETHYIAIASDRHNDETSIYDAMNGMPESVEYVSIIGDLVGNEGNDNNTIYNSSTIYGEIHGTFPYGINLHDQFSIVWGSHDAGVNDDCDVQTVFGQTQGSSRLIKTGYNSDGSIAYFVYGIAFYDMYDKNSIHTSYEEADIFKSWVSEQDPSIPVIVLCHMPLHHARSDNGYAYAWNEALNFAATGEEGVTTSGKEIIRDVIFLHGHNHTTERNYEYYIPIGSTIQLFDANHSSYIYYTYTTAGYLRDRTSATLIGIEDNSITISKYQNGSVASTYASKGSKSQFSDTFDTNATHSFERVVYENAVLDSITLDTSLIKTEYTIGTDTELDIDDLKVIANYSDGSSIMVSDYSVDLGEVDLTNEGTYRVYVYYTEGDVTAESYFDITVAKGCDHEYFAVVTEPTCEDDGFTTYTCSICGESYVDNPVAALGHDYEDTVTAPTCTEEGYTIHTCSRCGDRYVDAYTEALGHDYVGVVTKEATCTAEGVMTYTCSHDASHTYTEVIPKKAHTPEVIPAVAATCTETGLTEGSRCSVCGEILKAQEEVPAIGHDYVGVVTKEATCTAEGVMTYTCSHDASHTYTEVIPKKAHTAGEAVKENEKGSSCTEPGYYDLAVYCTVCGEELSRETVYTEVLGHDYEDTVTAPTCTEEGYTTHTCTRCGDSYKDTYTEALGHDYVGVITKEATCTAEGVMTYTCRHDASHTYTEAIPKKAHTAGEAVKENEKGSSCTEPGYYDLAVYCTVCGEELSRETVYTEVLGHDYAAVVTAPTCEEEGYTTHTCSRCGDRYVDAYTEALGHDYVGVVTKEATCTAEGVMTYTCSHDASHTYTEAIPKKAHTAGEAVKENEKGSSCTEPGYYDLAVYCSVCGEELSRETVYTEVLGHDYAAVVTAPTCTEEGYTTHTCSRCGDSYEDTFTEALGHDYVGVVTKEATCTAEGVMTYTCSHDASHTYTEIILKKAHTAGEAVKENEKGSSCTEPGYYDLAVYCTVCGEELSRETLYTEVLGHDYEDTVTAPTCEEEGYTTHTCSRCGDSYVDDFTDALGHDYEDTVTAPTCEEEGYTTHTCSRCGDSYKDTFTEALGHDYVGVVTKEATCTAEGVMTYTCSHDASHTYTETIPKKAHTPEVIPAVAATCTETGVTEGSRCSVCGEILKAQEEVPALGHDYVGVVTKEATCTAEGVMTYTCSHDASHTYTEIIPKKAHTAEVIPAVAATCTEAGLTEGSRCSVCGEILKAQEEVPALDHDYIAVVTAPTCEEEGYTTHTCSRCGDSYKDTFTEALGHDYVGVVTKEATCTAEGLMTYTCSHDASHTYTEAIPKKAHTPEVIPAVAATCTETGVTEGSRCSVCGEILKAQEEVPALGHDYKETIVEPGCTEEGYTTHTCSRCGDSYVDAYTEALGHDYVGMVTKEATCTEEGLMTYTCSHDASHTYTETIPKKAHTPEVIPAVAATCTETGVTEGSRCSVCGEILKAQEEVPALGHDYIAVVTAPTCTEEGYTTHTCSRCGDRYVDAYTEALGHDYVGVVTKEATCTAEGVMTYTCSHDASHTYTEAIPKKAHTAGEAVKENEKGSSCTEPGYYDLAVYCTVCGEELSRETVYTEALGHDYIAVVTAPTCTEEGYTTHTCSRCGDSYKDTYTEALGHDWDDGVVVNEPTPEAPGIRRYTCSRCEETRDEEIELVLKDIAEAELSLTSVVTKTKRGMYWVAYNGTEKKPDVSVQYGSDTLKEGTDYSVSYADNTKVGIATVTVTGQGYYTGTQTITFRITFTDVPLTHNFQSAVYWAFDRGIGAGYTGAKYGKFGVADYVTRGQVVMFLWRAAGKPEPKKNIQTFKDVPISHAFYKAIQWANEQGIAAGYSGSRKGIFGVNDSCTRGQIVTFMWRFAGKPTPAGNTQTFTDVPTSSNFYKAIQWAAENGITGGYTGNRVGQFGPNDTCTRGQCVTFLYRLLKE